MSNPGAWRLLLQGPIKPYVRMTRRGKWTDPQAQQYLASKAALQMQMKQHAQRHGWTCWQRTPLRVTLRFRWINRRADLDNYTKSLLDAANGILWDDDRWVDAIIAERGVALDGAGGELVCEMIIEPKGET